MQAKLLKDEMVKMDSMNLLRIMAPIAALMLLPAIALWEPDALQVALRLLRGQPNFAVLILANASLAYAVNFSNFQITKVTSALTMQVEHPIKVTPNQQMRRVMPLFSNDFRMVATYLSVWKFPLCSKC